MSGSKLCFVAAFCLVALATGDARAIELGSEHAILIDFDSGEVLYEKRADDIVAPSSTTKIMTAYVIFDMLDSGVFSLDSKFKVSIRAWRQDGTRMFLEPEWKVTVDELLRGAIVVSGNDAAVVLAEGSSGSIDEFVGKMNAMVKNLGMKNTHFDNPTGLYEKTHYTTVRDLATLSQALLDKYESYYGMYFSQQSFTFNGMTQKNRNPLLGDYRGVDGIKTGHTDQGKYTLVLSAVRNGKRLIAVLARAETEKERAADARALLDYGFSQYKHLRLFRKGDVVATVSTFPSKNNRIKVYASRDISYAVNEKRVDSIRVRLVYDRYILGPIKRGDMVAQLVVEDGNIISKYDLHAENDSRRLGRVEMFFALLGHNFRKLLLFSSHEGTGVLEN
ncbi:MAG: D-alanyl-D-alanine carboxypeptidase [Rickettsiales bacterium]|jgi:D-alanyl-D-alanine carboxypeptidase (penicillin-binding protein 5/6)|nr:D-alanyl-D-alanine carboxypeptidase [Rickettsiales bacterium]